MFQLLVTVVILIGGTPVLTESVVHRDTFQTEKACEATYSADKGSLRAFIAPQVPADAEIVLTHECRAEAADRSADAIRDILRAMNAAGGIAAVGR